VVLAAQDVACDPNAAYDPSQACQPAPAAVAPALAAGPLPVCDADAAYDPQQPCRPAPVQVIRTASVVPADAEPPPLVLSLPRRPAPEGGAPLGGDWGIQVGAFSSPERARQSAGGARAQLPDLLSGASVQIEPTTPFGSAVLYRARLVGLSARSAAAACARLQGSGTSCMTVTPGPI
jgi:D-alanyl-D-alanine carboxypeptidase